MDEVNIEAGIKSLSACLREMKSLLAWAELEKTEDARGTPPSFRIDNHIEEDLRATCGFFLKRAIELHEILNGKGAPFVSLAGRANWKRRLHQVEAEFRRLDLGQRFIKS
jgi:hypothetical protein